MNSADIIESTPDHEVAVAVHPENNVRIEKETDQTTFFPGAIHSEEVRDFWQRNLEAGEWVMDTLKNGYVIPFETFPEAYEEPNNPSAYQNMSSYIRPLQTSKIRES